MTFNRAWQALLLIVALTACAAAHTKIEDLPRHPFVGAYVSPEDDVLPPAPLMSPDLQEARRLHDAMFVIARERVEMSLMEIRELRARGGPPWQVKRRSIRERADALLQTLIARPSTTKNAPAMEWFERAIAYALEARLAESAVIDTAAFTPSECEGDPTVCRDGIRDAEEEAKPMMAIANRNYRLCEAAAHDLVVSAGDEASAANRWETYCRRRVSMVLLLRVAF